MPQKISQQQRTRRKALESVVIALRALLYSREDEQHWRRGELAEITTIWCLYGACNNEARTTVVVCLISLSLYYIRTMVKVSTNTQVSCCSVLELRSPYHIYIIALSTFDPSQTLRVLVLRIPLTLVSQFVSANKEMRQAATCPRLASYPWYGKAPVLLYPLVCTVVVGTACVAGEAGYIYLSSL